jgi:hypothetical protein
MCVYFSPNIITQRHKGTEKDRFFLFSFVSLCLGVRFFEDKLTHMGFVTCILKKSFFFAFLVENSLPGTSYIIGGFETHFQ